MRIGLESAHSDLTIDVQTPVKTNLNNFQVEYLGYLGGLSTCQEVLEFFSSSTEHSSIRFIYARRKKDHRDCPYDFDVLEEKDSQPLNLQGLIWISKLGVTEVGNPMNQIVCTPLEDWRRYMQTFPHLRNIPLFRFFYKRKIISYLRLRGHYHTFRRSRFFL